MIQEHPRRADVRTRPRAGSVTLPTLTNHDYPLVTVVTYASTGSIIALLA